jgi:hypothetical protein
MSLKNNGFWTTASIVVLATGLTAQSLPSQAPTPQKAAPPPQADRASQPFRISIDLVTNDIIVRDEKGNFVSDLEERRVRDLGRRRQARHHVDDRGDRR